MNDKECEKLTYDRAKEFILKFKLKTKKDWERYIKGNFKNLVKPDNIPNDPENYYKNLGWKSWNHFFSTHVKFKK